MQDPVVDKKIQVIYDNYRDNLYAKNAQQEVEAIRRKATYTGAGITAAAFIGNEVSRLTLRSRKYPQFSHLAWQFVCSPPLSLFLQHCSN